MTHLVIENQNSNTEIVSAAIILKLYEMALSAEGDVSLKGNLLSNHAKLTAYDYLTGNLPNTSTKRFPNLTINITDGVYIQFADPEVERILLANNIGDGVGITTAVAAATTGKLSDMFKGSSITSFDELALFGWNRLFDKSNTDPTEGCFYNCTSLVSIDLDNIINNIGASNYKHAFANCTSLTTVKNIHFNPNVGIFLNCTALLTIDLSDIPSKIDNSSFNGCTSLTTVITPTDHNFTIGASAFKGCNHLTTIDLSYCTSIGGENNGGAFQSCFSLTTIDTSNVTSFGLNAFLSCSSITSIDLSSCTSLGNSVFSGCTSLSNVTWPNQNFTIASNVFKGTNLTGSLTINHLTSINSSAFENTKVTAVDFSGSTFISFPNNVFKGVSTLTSVKFPTTLTTLGASGDNLNFGSGNTTIDVYGLDNLTSTLGGRPINRNVGNAVYCGELLEENFSPILANDKTITVKQLYFPKYKWDVSSKIVYINLLTFPYNSMFHKSAAGFDLHATVTPTNTKIGLLYFRDLLIIYSWMFYGARPKNLVINNITPPLFTQSTYPTNSNGGTLSQSSVYSTWDPKPFGAIPYDQNDTNCMTIYVPDSAVATYQANSLYNMYTIRGINEINPNTNQPYLIRYATNALWEAAGRPDDALIEEYMQ